MPKTETDHFDKINQYYSEYCSLLGQENVESALLTSRNKIIIEVGHIFYLDENGQYIPDDCNGHDKKKKKKENKEYSYEICIKVIECLKFFTMLEGKGSFAEYVISCVHKMLNTKKERNSILPQMKVPEYKKILIKKIKKLDSQLELLIPNKSERMKFIQQDLKLSDKLFKECIRIMNEKKVLSLETPVGDESEDEYIDFVGDDCQNSTEFRLESESESIEILDCMQEQWQEAKAQALLMDLLTRDILKKILKSSNPSLDRDTLKKYEFINQDMVENFFTDRSYKLPTLEKIGMTHGGMTKGNASKVLSKFLMKLKDKISSI